MRTITKIRFVKDYNALNSVGVLVGCKVGDISTVQFADVSAELFADTALRLIKDGYAVPVWDDEPKPDGSPDCGTWSYTCKCGTPFCFPGDWESWKHTACGHKEYNPKFAISPERDELIARLTLDRDDARNALRKKIAQVIDISNHRDEWREKAKASEKLCAKAIQERDAERAEKAAVVGKLMFNLDIETQRANSNYDLANALCKQLRDTERERDEAKESLDCMTREQSALDYLNNTRKASTKPAGDRKET